MKWPAALAAFLMIALLTSHAVLPSEASAQPRADTARARRLFEEAMTSMDDGAYDVAIERFQASLALAPRPATAFNLALALRGAGRIREAIATLDALLAGEHGPLRDQQRGEADQLRTEATTDLATVRVRVSGPADLELRVDGERVAAEPGAWVEHRLDPGEHVVTASAPDHATVERPIALARRAWSELDLALEPASDTRPGVLVLQSTDPSHVVEIVGLDRATAMLRRELPAGEYTVRITSGDGHRDSRIEVPAGRTVRLTLEPPVVARSVAEEPWLWITVGAVVLVGGGVAIGAGVYASEQRQAPLADPIFGTVETLTWR